MQLYRCTNATRTRSPLSVECGVSVILPRHVIWGHPIRCAFGSNSRCHLFRLKLLGSNDSENDFTVNPRLLCSSTLASVSCGFFVIRLRPRSGTWRWHSSVWKCGCHQHNSSVCAFDSLMNFNWDHFDVEGVTHCRSTSNEIEIIFVRFKIMAFQSQQNPGPSHHKEIDVVSIFLTL